MTGSPTTTPSKAGSATSGFRPILSLLRPYRRDLRGTIGNGIADQVLAIAAAVVAAYMVGRAVRGASADQLWPWFILLGFLVVPQLRTRWLEFLGSNSISHRIQVELRARILAAFERLAPGYLLRRRSADLAFVAMSDVDEIERFFSGSSIPLLVGVVVPGLALIALATIGWQLAVAFLLVLWLSASVPWWLHRHSERQGRHMRAQAEATSAETVDAVQGLREILAFGNGGDVLRRLTEATDGLGRLRAQHSRHWGLERSAAEALTSIGLLVVVTVGAVLVANGTLRPTMLAPSVVLAWLSFGPVIRLHHAAKELQRVRSSGERIFGLLGEPAPVVDRVSEPPVHSITPSISFTEVSFRYGPDEPEAIRHVSVSIPAGATVALVGHSGAGKSTCVQLLMRFFDVTEGSIAIGDVDVRDLPLKTLRELVAYVPQDVYLFNVSVAENIRLGRREATDPDVKEAARQAIADEFVTALPEGYETIVGERGAQLSGGERQRIAIARALLQDAPVLVMDEPVSNLDTESELALREAMARVRRGRTTLVIAHRLSTIKSADSLIVLESGRVVETGSHAELVTRGGPYARLMASQVQVG